MRDSHSAGADTSRIGPVIRIGGNHLLRSTENGARVCHWGRTDAGSVDGVCEGMGDSGRGVRIGLVISIVTLHSAALTGRGSDGVGHVGGVLNTILVGVEGRTRVGRPIVDRAVRVGVWRGRECAKVCSTHSR
jgi:hypothetical protein